MAKITTADVLKLRALEQALREPLPEKHVFDIDVYIEPTLRAGFSCGTSCCAVGLGIIKGIITSVSVSLRDGQGTRGLTYTALGSTVADELGLTSAEYFSLFMPEAYEDPESDDDDIPPTITSDMVADRIHAFIDKL